MIKLLGFCGTLLQALSLVVSWTSIQKGLQPLYSLRDNFVSAFLASALPVDLDDYEKCEFGVPVAAGSIVLAVAFGMWAMRKQRALLSLLSVFFSVGGAAAFGVCYQHLKDDGQEDELHAGPFLLALGAVLHVVAAVFSLRSSDSAEGLVDSRSSAFGGLGAALLGVALYIPWTRMTPVWWISGISAASDSALLPPEDRLDPTRFECFGSAFLSTPLLAMAIYFAVMSVMVPAYHRMLQLASALSAAVSVAAFWLCFSTIPESVGITMSGGSVVAVLGLVLVLVAMLLATDSDEIGHASRWHWVSLFFLWISLWVSMAYSVPNNSNVNLTSWLMFMNTEDQALCRVGIFGALVAAVVGAACVLAVISGAEHSKVLMIWAVIASCVLTAGSWTCLIDLEPEFDEVLSTVYIAAVNVFITGFATFRTFKSPPGYGQTGNYGLEMH